MKRHLQIPIVLTERATVAFGKVSVNERKTSWDIWRSDITSSESRVTHCMSRWTQRGFMRTKSERDSDEKKKICLARGESRTAWKERV